MRVIQEITDAKIGRMIDEFTASAHKEEEKTMRNHEKFAQQMAQAEPKDRACTAAALRGIYCQENWNDIEECYDCMKESMAWLYEKADEPKLLKNGDGLKPGDWIMVRDHNDDSWNKKMFAFYYDKAFFVLDDYRSNGHFNIDGVNVTGWEQARLPEEGE